MSFSFEWQIPDRAVLLTIRDILTLHDAQQINDELTVMLEQAPGRVILIIDADQMVSNLPFDRVRQIFTFMTNRKLYGIFAVASSKLNRLLLTVIFVMTTANFRLFDTKAQALSFTEMQLERHSL